MRAPRHFLDLSDLPAATLRGIIDDSRRMKPDDRRRAEDARSKAERLR